MIEKLLILGIVFLIGLVALWRTKDEAKDLSFNRYDDKVVECVGGRFVLVDKRG